MSIPPAVGGPYPHEHETDVVLRDGSTARVRPVRPDDEAAIREFLGGVSPDSIAFRFFGGADLEWVTRWSLDVDYADRFALIAESGAPSRVLAHAAYVRIDAERAEVAFLVTDRWQGRGISTILLFHLADAARQHGISIFAAEVLPANHRMIDLFRESGFPVHTRSTPDAIEIELPTSLSDAALARFEERERTSAVAAARGFLIPRSVAVIGASRHRGTVGGEILHNLIVDGFEGAVYAVNARADVVQSLPAYRSIGEVSRPVDLAVLVVPADQVVAAALECAAKGVRSLLVISAGFAESGADGARRQHELVEACRDGGMRLVGPNCFGVLNTAADVHLNATFSPRAATPGRVGFLSQSGAVGIAIIEAADRLGVGLSSFVSVGNMADISSNDLLQYWEQDEDTDVALLYVESVGNPRKFARIAPRVARRKPVLAVKSGRSAAGARATSSHTGAMLSASDVTVDALFEQAGVIRAETLHEMFDAAALLSTQPVPRGDRVAIVTNAGGPGILCADALHAAGVEIRELPAAVRAQLAEFLPPTASLGNPIDMIATATAAHYRRALQTLVDADAFDAILAIFVPPLVTAAAEVATAIREVAETAAGRLPIAAVFMTGEGAPAELTSTLVKVPSYEFPEDAARALAHAARHGRWRARPPGEVPELGGIRADQAAAIISQGLGAGGGWLPASDVWRLLDCYRLPIVTTRFVADAEEAGQVAAELGRPVALKASAPGLVHKTDAGAVALGLDGPAAVRDGARQIEAAVTRAGFTLERLIVQPMAPSGVELIVGVVNDHSFGPVIACGAGGTAAELIRDIAVRITPLTDIDAGELVRSLRTFPLLDGYRGASRCDVGAIEDVLLRVSALVEAHPEISELDCNPLVAGPDGAVILDARVRIEPVGRPAPMASLRS